MLLSEVFNLPEKQWTQDGNHVYAEIVSIQPYKSDQYGFKQPCILRCIPSKAEMTITIQTKYEKGLLNPAMVGAKASWRLKWYNSKAGKQLVGYCLDKLPDGGQPIAQAQVAPQGGQWTPPAGQHPSQNQPQAPPQAAQGAKASKDVDWDAKDLRMARMSGLNNATKLICLLAEMTKNDDSLNVSHVKGVAAEFVDYIYNGLSKNTVKQAADDAAQGLGNHYDGAPPPTDDDVLLDNIPWHD